MRKACLCFAVFIVAWCVLLQAHPVSAQMYFDAYLGAVIISTGSSGSLQLVPDASFPQVTINDVVNDTANPATVNVTVGIELDFAVGSIEMGGDFHSGTMKINQYETNIDGEDYLFFEGRFDLTISANGGSYDVQGPVIGDQFTTYMAYKYDGVAPPEVALIRANIIGGIPFGTDEYAIGAVRIIQSRSLKKAISDDVSSSEDNPESDVPLDSPGLPDGSVIYQVYPGDDITLVGDHATKFVTDLTHNGTLNGTGPSPLPGRFDFSWNSLEITEAGPNQGMGSSYGRFIFRPDSGGYMEGFMVGVSQNTGTAIGTEGYIFSIASRGKIKGLLFGNYEASFTPSYAAFSSPAFEFVPRIYYTASAPPEAWVAEGDTLHTDDWSEFMTVTRDMNGWCDQKAVLLIIDSARKKRRIMARYNPLNNKLYLYNKILKKWLGGYRPGSSRIIRTPWVKLNCQNTQVIRRGEYVIVVWSLKPTAKMLGTKKVWVKVSDTSKQTAGWRLLQDDLDILSP